MTWVRLDESTVAIFKEAERQRRLVASVHEPDPWIRMLIEEKRREERFLRDLIEPPALRELHAIHRKLDDQRRMFRDLLADPGIGAGLSGVPGIATPDFVRQTGRIRDELRDEIATELAVDQAPSADTPDLAELD